MRRPPAPAALVLAVATTLIPATSHAATSSIPSQSAPQAAAPHTTAMPAVAVPAATTSVTTTSATTSSATTSTAARTTAARPYDGQAAVAYAARYTVNGDTRHRAYNPRYTRYRSDCTNFASQALVAGGLRPSRTWRPYTRAWLSAPHLYRELRGRGVRVSTYAGAALRGHRTNARPGDLYFYDWGKGLGISHVAVAGTDGLQVRVDWDGRWHTDGTGSRIIQHTTDRDGAAWNLGWITRPADVDPRRMRVYVVHVR